MNSLLCCDFNQFAAICRGERVVPWSDKSFSVDDKYLWCTREDWIEHPGWLEEGMRICPTFERDYLLPKPERDYKTFKKEPIENPKAMAWLTRIFRKAGYSKRLAWEKRKLHALRKTIVAMGSEDRIPEEDLRRLGGWASSESMRPYVAESSANLQTKAQIISKRRTKGPQKVQKKTGSMPMHKRRAIDTKRTKTHGLKPKHAQAKTTKPNK